MKKVFTAIILIISIILSDMAVFAQSSAYTTVFEEDFEKGSTLFSTVDGKNHSNTFDSDGTGIGKAYRGYYTKSGNAFGEKIYLLDNCATEGANSFVETEFDVYVEDADALTQGSMRVKLHTSAVTEADPDFVAEFTALVFDFSDHKLRISGSNAELCSFESNKWYRVKIVIRNTDSSAERYSRVSAVYINGRNLLSEESVFASTNTAKLLYYDRISVAASGLGSGNIVYWKMDNVSVRKYNSSDKSSPVEDRGRLISLIRESEDVIENQLLTETEKNTLTRLRENSLNIYNDYDRTAAEIAAQSDRLESCLRRLSGIKERENFENNVHLFNVSDSTYNTVAADGVFNIGNAYRAMGNVSSNTITAFEEIAAAEKGGNAEIGFDFLTERLISYSGGDIQLKFMRSEDSAVLPCVVRYNAETAAVSLVCGDSEFPIGKFADKEWNNIRLCFSLTDNSGALTEKITHAYFNGEKYVLNEAAASGIYGGFDTLIIECSEADLNYWRIDNFEISVYGGSYDDSFFANIDRLQSALRTAENRMNSGIRLLTEEEQLNCEYDAAVNVYNEATAAENLLQAAEKLEAAIDALSSYEENIIAEDNFEAEASLFKNGKDVTFDDYAIGKAHDAVVGNSRIFEKTYLFGSGKDPWSDEYSCVQMGKNCFVEAEFDIYFDQIVRHGGVCQLSLTSDVIAEKENTGIVMLNFDGKNGTVELHNATVLGELKDKEWIRIKIVVQITDGQAQECKKITQIYINGRETLDDSVSFSSTSAHKLPYLNVINLVHVSDFTGVDCYMDNFTVKRYNGSNTAVNKGALVCEIRKGEDRLSDMAEFSGSTQYSQLETEMENAKTAFEDESISQSETDAAAEALSSAISQSYVTGETIESVQAVFSDENGKMQPFTNGAKTIEKIIVKNELPRNTGGKAYAAVYEQDGKLVDVMSADFSIESQSDGEIAMGFDVKDYTADKIFKLFFLSGEMVPMGQQHLLKGIIEQSGEWSIKIDGLSVETDVQPQLTYSGELMVPAENICRVLGIDFYEYEEYSFAERSDGRRLEFTHNSNRAMIDGNELLLNEAVYTAEAQILMVPMSALVKAFDIEYVLDAQDLTLNITSSYTETARSAENSEISVESGEYSASFQIPYADSSATAEVWFRMNRDSIVNWTTTAEEAGLNSVLVEDGFSAFVWRKAYTADYSDGAFRGSIGNLRKGGRYYDVRVRITKDGELLDEFIALQLFRTKYGTIYTNEELAPYSDSGMTLIPTYENISFYVDGAEAANCEITYCEKNNAQKTAAYTPYYSEETGQFSGSITGLSENTLYCVTALLTDESGNEIKSVTEEITTWQENPPIAQEIDINDIYSKGALVLENLEGTEDGWIKIDCGGAVIDGGKNNPEAVYIYGCKYLILENAVVKGGYRSGINITGDSEYIRISNIDISEWSRSGVFNEERSLYIRNGVSAGYNGGINALDAKNITIERCYIHDSNAMSNAWSGDTWAFVHPSGPDGIVYKAKTGVVIRYNDIIGNDYHRWNDGMECYLNGVLLSGPGFDGDIYGNMITQANDDAIEVDSGGRNVRIYRNRIEHTYCGISTAPLKTGPLYIFRNIITDVEGNAIKTGSSSDGNNGVQYLFNNTIDAISAMGNSNEHIAITRNNIFASSGKYSGNSIINPTADERSSYDYDITRGAVKLSEGNETHGINGKPSYENAENGIYIPKEGDISVDAGINLAGFDGEVTDGKTDIGAFERGSNLSFLPYRPIDITADKYSVTLKPGESTYVTFNIGESCEKQSYSVKMSKTVKWLTVTGNSAGELSGGESITLELYCDEKKLTAADEQTTVLLRTSSGYSVPITVRIDK